MQDKKAVLVAVGVPAAILGMVAAQERKYKPETPYTWGWLAWAAVTAGGFAALEGWAVGRGQHGNTLSAHWRRTFGIHPRKRWHPVSRTAVCGGLFWVAYHIAFESGEDPRLRVSGIVGTSDTTSA